MKLMKFLVPLERKDNFPKGLLMTLVHHIQLVKQRAIILLERGTIHMVYQSC